MARVLRYIYVLSTFHIPSLHMHMPSYEKICLACETTNTLGALYHLHCLQSTMYAWLHVLDWKNVVLQ